MKTATFRYKCKQCGNFQLGTSTSVVNAELILLSIINHRYDMIDRMMGSGKFSTTILHHCQEGVGLADLVGYIVEDK